MPDPLDPPLGPATTSTARRRAAGARHVRRLPVPVLHGAQPILRRVRDRLGGRLRFAFRHFPLPRSIPTRARAAEASEAAAAQGAFWPMHDALYARAGSSGSTTSSRAAAELGLDVERVRAELEAGPRRAGGARRRERPRPASPRDADVLRQRRPPHGRVRRPVADRRARGSEAAELLRSSASSSSLSSPR